MGRKRLKFGGDRLRDPQWTWFYSALTRGQLHGHPGDEALIVSKDEASELSKRMYAGIPSDTRAWTGDHEDKWRGFAGKKLILASHAQGYVTRKQAQVVESDDDPLTEYLGIKSQTAAPEPAIAEEENNGD
jgi:hypothetical protein